MDSVVDLPELRAAVAPRTGGRQSTRRALMVVGAVTVVGLAGVVALRAAPASVTTDNAYLKSDHTIVAPRVRGLVAEVLVADNQRVVQGQPLIRLDGEEYAARLSGAEGDLALAQAQVQAADAALGRLDAELRLAGAQVREAGAGVRGDDAQAARAQADRRRFDALAEQGFVSHRDAERMRAEAATAEAAAEQTHAALAVSREQAAVALRRRGEVSAQLLAARAQEAKAAAAVRLARQDTGHALVRAPISGVVGDRQVNPGDYVQPGARLLVLAPGRDLYITANFKETQTTRMVPGQPAVVKVDALPGVKLRATVQSLAPGSGSEFALLPFEPGSGNFTKVVQRVPVRLVFEPGQPAVAKLRSGLSVKVTVKVAPGVFERAGS